MGKILSIILLLPLALFSQQIKQKKDSIKTKEKIVYTWDGRVVKKRELKSLMKIFYFNYIDSAYSPTKKSSQN